MMKHRVLMRLSSTRKLSMAFLRTHQFAYRPLFPYSLEHGLAPTGGWGLGIDRLVMFLTDSTSTSSLVYFSHE